MKNNRFPVLVAAVGLAVVWMFMSACPAAAQWQVTEQLLPAPASRGITVYTAKKILTMDRSNPEATAVAVAGTRILAVGSLDEVKANLADRPFTMNDTFKSKVILPGLIDQHLHPILGTYTLHRGDFHGGLGSAGTHFQGNKQLTGIPCGPQGC